MHDPYKFQVISAGHGEPFVAAIVNGLLCGSLSGAEPKDLVLPEGRKKNRARIVCYSPAVNTESPLNLEVILRCRGQDYRLGSLVRTGVVSGTFDLPQNEFQLFTREPKTRIRTCPHQEAQNMLSNVLQIFHDGKLNPSFGALRVGSLQSAIENSFAHDLASLLRAQKDFCHCYKGKDDETWVVLHSHCKKVTVGHENTAPYAFLLLDTAKRLRGGEVSLGDIFRRVAGSQEFNALLASNFTILKKFLIKYNNHFAWFQDDESKTTKVVLH